MKILYIFTSPSIKGSSVQTKVLNQIKYLNKAGADCRGAFFSTEVNEVTPLNEYVDFVPVRESNWKYFKAIGQLKILNKTMSEFISQRFDKTDIFYLRYPGASKGLFKISKKFGAKIVSEHQSKEIDEIKSHENQNQFGLRPSKLMSWYLYTFLPIYNENKWGSSFAKHINSIVTVTNEIARYQSKKGCKNVIVSTNGIDVSSFILKEIIKPKEPLTLLFLKGTTSIAEWNGINRLIEGIDKLETPEKKIKLVICGHYINGEIPHRNYIEHKGYLNKEELNGLFNEVDLGISTLALHKKNLNEASVLKSREYVARGLPFIYAYIDPDLNDEAKAFSLEFPNDDSAIDMQKVIDFAKKIALDTDHPQKMRKYAEEHLDYEVKMKRLLLELNKL